LKHEVLDIVALDDACRPLRWQAQSAFGSGPPSRRWTMAVEGAQDFGFGLRNSFGLRPSGF
jgi:hypothetical protein